MKLSLWFFSVLLLFAVGLFVQAIPQEVIENRYSSELIEFYEMPSGVFVFDNYIFSRQGDIIGYITKLNVAKRLDYG